ncbi:MAG TPA: hypothetical protein PLE61_01040 [Vicinamibacterales bacterium]|nr:hypothetical protein [Vicinamibacterales bacterium]
MQGQQRTVDAVRVALVTIASIALLWALANSFYVYVILHGSRAFRVESSAFLLAAAVVPLALWYRSDRRFPAVLTDIESRILLVTAAGLGVLSLAPFLTLPFLSDDYVFLAAYRDWSDAWRVWQFFRPVFAFVFLILAKLGRGTPLPFHVASLFLHIACAVSVYVLSRRLIARVDAAALCSALFLLNPLQPEAVLWASGLQELLWSFFMLASLVVYTGTQCLSAGRLLATLLLVSLSLLSKETAVSFVLLLPLADWAFFKTTRGRLLLPAYLALALLVTAYLLLRSWSASVESGFLEPPTRYFVQKLLATPYKFFVQPWNAAATDIAPFASFCVTALALGAVFGTAASGLGGKALVGPMIILAGTLPVYAHFYVAADLRGARYLYFPAFGWALFISQAASSLLHRRLHFLTAAVALIALACVSLQLNLKPWKTAAEIVDAVSSTIVSGGAVEARSSEFRERYGTALEMKDEVPVAYKGVYLFVNGYPELRRILREDRGTTQEELNQSGNRTGRGPARR